MIKTYENINQNQLEKIAFQLAQKVKPGTLICLNGDLGVGKTTFTKELAKGLNIKEIVNSPTFTIMKIYESGKLPLYHFDIYRLDNIDDLGFESYFDGDGIAVVEWSNLVEDFKNMERLEITINYAADLQKRCLIIENFGSKYDLLMEELNENINY